MWKKARKVGRRNYGGGFQQDEAAANGIIFSTIHNVSANTYFVSFRIGREIAKKAGLSTEDFAALDWVVKDGTGMIKAVPPEDG